MSQVLHVPRLSESEPCCLIVFIPLAQYKDAPVDSLASEESSLKDVLFTPRLGACV